MGEISRRLGDRALSLAAEMFPGGHREGNDYVCTARAQGGPGDSLKIVIAGPERGHYKHFGEGHGGDLIDLIAHYRCHGNLKEARREARRWLGLEPGEAPRNARVPADDARAKADAAELERKRAKARKIAQAIWLAGSDELAATPVDWYLKGRGIDVGALAAPPRALRYHPELDYPWQSIARRDPPEGLARVPAMVAHVCSAMGEQIAVHRTYLEIVKPGSAVKLGAKTTIANINAKLTLGSPKGGLIRLSNGTMIEKETGWVRPGPPLKLVTEKAARGDYESIAFDRIYLAEGIENALTWATARPDCRVAATVSLANMAHVVLPEFLKTVVLIRDNDAGREARALFDKAIWRLKGQGRDVRVIEPPAPFKDLNDYLRAGAA